MTGVQTCALPISSTGAAAATTEIYTRAYTLSLHDALPIIEQAHDEAWQVLNTNRDVLDRLASELLEKETLDHNQLAEIFEGLEKLPERPQWLSSTNRPLSDRPPVKVPSKLPIDPEVVDGGIDSEPPVPPKRAPRPRKTPGIATA